MTSTPSHAVGVMVGGRSPALSALAAAVGRSPLLSSRSPPLRATAPEFQPSDFNLTTTTTTPAATTNTSSASTATSLLDDEPKQSTRSSRTSSTGHADVTALTKALLAQCHYYFSDHNISKDKWMKDKLGLDDGWIPVSLLCDMPRIRQLTNDPAMLVCALRQSDKLEMSGDSQKTRRISNNPIPGNGGGGMNGNKGRSMDAKRSIFVDRLPAGHNGRTIRDLFSRFGRVDHVVALAPGGNGEGVVLESPQGTMYTLGAGEVLRGVFIEFEKQGAAKKAVSQISHFNKLLKQSKSGSSSPVMTTTLQRKSSNATDSAPASPVAAAASTSSTQSSFSSPPSTLLHDIPAALITSSSSSSTTTVTMTPYMGPSSAHSSLSAPTVPIATTTSSSSPAIPPPVQLPAVRTAPSSPTSASPSPVSPDSPVASSSPTSPSSSTPSMSPVPLEAKDSGGGKKEELGDAFIGMKVMSRYAYDKKFGHLSPAIGPMVGSMAGIPIFGLAGGSPILMASPPQHVAHLATSLSASMSPASSPVAATMIPMGGLTFTTTNGTAASANTASTSSSTATAASTAKKASSRVQTRDRSNWRIDATPSAGSGTDSADVTPSSSPSSSPPSRAHRTSSFEDSELIAAFMDDGSNSSPLPSPAAALTKTASSSSAAGGVGAQSSSVSAAAAKKARKNNSSRSSTDFTMAATAAAVAAKKDDSETVLPPTRRPLQLLQRKELNKPAGGVWRIAVGPDPGNRGFGGRGRGRPVTK